MSNPQLTLFYDGLCPLCSREIDRYRARAAPGAVAFLDITDPAFDARAHGLDPRAVHRSLHVRDADGTLHTGVDAFAALWEVVPGFRWLSRLVRLPLVYQVARLGYALFARMRPVLPR